jgi:hypothetical protein
MPAELNLSAPPTLPQARSYISKQLSEYTEYDVKRGNKIRVDIPRLQRSYLMKDSYIRFRVNIDMSKTTNDVANEPMIAFDKCGAYGLFDRIEVYDYLGGTLIEQTNNVPALISMLVDVDNDILSTMGQSSVNGGFGEAGIFIDANGSEEDYSDNDPALCLKPPVNGSRIWGRVLTDPQTNVFTTFEVCIPVISFLGTLSDKYVPLHNGFSVYFHLNSVDNAFITRSTAQQADNDFVTFQDVWITNFEYVCQIMELGDQAEAIVQSTEPLVIHSKQYRHFTDMILGGGLQSAFRFDLNLNVVSLRNLFFTMRPTYYQNSRIFPCYGHRIRNFLENWNFQYGSSYLPEIAGIASRSSSVPGSRNGYTPSPVITKDIMGTNVTLTNEFFKSHGSTQCLEELSKTVGRPCTNMSSYYCIDTAFHPGSDTAGDITKSAVPWQYRNNKLNPTLDDLAYKPAGQFVGGLNTRLSRKNTVSGIDTNGLQLSINGSFDRDRLAYMLDAIMDVWAEHDAFVQIIPGVATTVTF